MPTTPGGIWTPNDTDDWDLIVDLAAMAVSIDDSINAVPTNYLVGTNAERLASTTFEGLTFYTTDTNTLWRHNGSTWGLFNQSPFSAVQTHNTGSGVVNSTSGFGPLTGISVTQAVTVGVACRAKVTLSAEAYFSASGSNLILGVAASGATTLAPSSDGPGAVRASSISGTTQSFTLGSSQIVNLNPGTTTFTLQGLAGGNSGTRTARFITLIIEPVA